MLIMIGDNICAISGKCEAWIRGRREGVFTISGEGGDEACVGVEE